MAVLKEIQIEFFGAKSKGKGKSFYKGSGKGINDWNSSIPRITLGHKMTGDGALRIIMKHQVWYNNCQ